MSSGLTLTNLIISIWVACIAGVKRGGVGWGVRKKRRREEKMERGSLLLFLTLLILPGLPPLAPVTQASVWGIS